MLNTISLSCCHLPTKSSLPSSLHICITSSLSLPCGTHSSSSFHPCSSSYVILHLVSEINFLFICQPHPRLTISDSPLPTSVTAASSVDSPISSIIIHNSPNRSLQAYLKPVCFTDPSQRRLFRPQDCHCLHGP